MTETTFAEPFEKQHDTAAHPERLEQLQFHIKSGDYFPLLSTLLCFVEEGMRSCESGEALTLPPVEADLIRSLREDLIYLHKHYSIEPKTA